MIRLDSISKQNGHQILFIEASAALHKGEKVGLVGPNGAGKTTLFRMIIGQEQPDEGQVSVPSQWRGSLRNRQTCWRGCAPIGMASWLGRQGSNLGMTVPKTVALPLGYAPFRRLYSCVEGPDHSRPAGQGQDVGAYPS